MPLVGCFEKGCQNRLVRPFNMAVMAPFVKMTITDVNGNYITVGNESNPALDGGRSYNHTVIKSFKYGSTTAGGGGGYKMEVEITDEAGGSFATFVNRMIGAFCPTNAHRKGIVKVQWGWIGANCDGFVDDLYSKVHTGILMKVTSTFAHGLMKFNLDITDDTPLFFQLATDGNHGMDNMPIPIKEAIRQLAKQYNFVVEFLRPHTFEEWKFDVEAAHGVKGMDGRELIGAKSVFRDNTQNPIDAIKDWVQRSGLKTDRGLGIVPQTVSVWDSSLVKGQIKKTEKSHLILWEDHQGSPDKTVNGCFISIGTYIVNGGKDSPVLSFNPQLESYFQHQSMTGGGSSTTSNEQIPQQTLEETFKNNCNGIKPGSPTFETSSESAVRIHGTLLAYRDTVEANKMHDRAAIPVHPTKAEMRIQGDPKLDDPRFLNGKFISLVVINPHHIQETVVPLTDQNGNVVDMVRGPDEWLQADPCNAVLTNTNWLILGSFHEIKEGVYTTTLQLSLSTPGSDIAYERPFGNSPDGFRRN